MKVTVAATLAAIDATAEPLTAQDLAEALGDKKFEGVKAYSAMLSYLFSIQCLSRIQVGRKYAYGKPALTTATEAHATFTAASKTKRAALCAEQHGGRKRSGSYPDRHQPFLLGELWK